MRCCPVSLACWTDECTQKNHLWIYHVLYIHLVHHVLYDFGLLSILVCVCRSVLSVDMRPISNHGIFDLARNWKIGLCYQQCTSVIPELVFDTSGPLQGLPEFGDLWPQPGPGQALKNFAGDIGDGVYASIIKLWELQFERSDSMMQIRLNMLSAAFSRQ